MKLRLTDGSELELVDCREECDPELGNSLFICEVLPTYNFDELSKILNKDEIAEILSVFDEDNNLYFQTKNYTSVKSLVNDIKRHVITIQFYNKKDEKWHV